jgi:lipid-binding SYLF domain-containing protein
MFAGLALGAALAIAAAPAAGLTPNAAAKIDRESRTALADLYAKTPAARLLQKKAVAILVFPDVTKAGIVVGGQYGEGTLFKNGKSNGYYSTAGVSYGLQLGAQTYGYALFVMNNAALAQLGRAGGFELGVGPSLVVVDEGVARSLTTMTAQKDIYAFIFDQHGLMAGLGVQGNKLTRLEVK